MSDFWLYFMLGLEHVLDWKAYDHVLFLIVLCAAYTFDQWKQLLLLVTLFTIGHSASLLLANYDIVTVSVDYIEFLIPITILVTAIFNLINTGKAHRLEKMGLFYVVTVFFGLIHGFGFATYNEMINSDHEFSPMASFALGIETAQIIVVLIVLILALVSKSLFRFSKRDWTLVISSIVIGMVVPMLIENWPF